MKEIKKMNKKQVEEEIDRVFDEREDIIWKLIDNQFRSIDLLERQSELEEES